MCVLCDLLGPFICYRPIWKLKFSQLIPAASILAPPLLLSKVSKQELIDQHTSTAYCYATKKTSIYIQTIAKIVD